MYTAGQTTRDIARHFGVHVATLRKALYAAGVRLRSGHPSTWDDATVQHMVARHKQGFSLKEIALEFASSAPSISKVLTAAGVVLERKAMGAKHGQWRGGRFVSKGYVYVQVLADSPFASMRNHSGYVLEHRLVMAQHLGRPLLRGETVHHKNNNDTQNNVIANLQLRQGRHGKGGAFQCADCGSHNVRPISLAEGAMS